MENRFGNYIRGHLVNPLPHSKVYKCIAPSSHLTKFCCYQCTKIIILHAVPKSFSEKHRDFHY